MLRAQSGWRATEENVRGLGCRRVLSAIQSNGTSPDKRISASSLPTVFPCSLSVLTIAPMPALDSSGCAPYDQGGARPPSVLARRRLRPRWLLLRCATIVVTRYRSRIMSARIAAGRLGTQMFMLPRGQRSWRHATRGTEQPCRMLPRGA